MSAVKPKLNATAIKASGSSSVKSEVQLMPGNLSMIENYENNPRFIENDKFDEIKEGIKSSGKYTGVIDVTKRPGDKNFITFFGAGTRLKALKELYEETDDQGFYNVNLAVHPFPGEAVLINNHLAENAKRSDLSLIEVAQSVLDLKAELEKELSAELNDLQFTEYTAENFNYKVVRQRLPEYRFIVELNTICPEAVQNGMGRPMLREIMQVNKNLKTICKKLEIEDDAEEIFTNAFFEFQGREKVDPKEILAACVECMAGSYTDQPENKIWAILNEETDTEIPTEQKPKKKQRGMSFNFLPNQIKDLVSVKNGMVILSLPEEPLDRKNKGYTEACVAFNLLLPLAEKAYSEKDGFMKDLRSLIGDIDSGLIENIEGEKYLGILKGISALGSKTKGGK